jgi:tRNA-dihydrouridine synthase
MTIWGGLFWCFFPLNFLGTLARLVREHACVPVVANGSIHSLADVEHVHERTGCAGMCLCLELIAGSIALSC